MQINKVTQEELNKALEIVNKRYEGNITLSAYPQGKNFKVHLGYTNRKLKGVGRASSGRANGSACWHVYGWFFEVLLDINPNATIKTMIGKITKDCGNWHDIETGSTYTPSKMSENCDCWNWDNTDYEAKQITSECFTDAFSSEPLTIPIKLKVHQDYDSLDALAKKNGYETKGNDPSYCGWVATMGDDYHNPSEMVKEMNDKLEAAKAQGLNAVIGLNQTGNFSVGYTIYTKA